MPEQESAPPRRRGRPPAGHAAAGSSGPNPDGPRVEALERAFHILQAFDEDHVRLTLAEVALRTGLYPSTVLRLAGSMVRFGFLHRDREGRFRLGPTPLRLGQLYRQGFDLKDYVRPALGRLCQATGETAAFYVRDGDKRICLYRHYAAGMLRHHIDEGVQLPLERGAGGRLLLAFTNANDPDGNQVRALGIAISLGERDPEIAAIAAPVHSSRSVFLGALCISGLRTRFKQPRIDDLCEVLRAEASALSGLLGGGSSG